MSKFIMMCNINLFENINLIKRITKNSKFQVNQELKSSNLCKLIQNIKKVIQFIYT